MPSGSFRIRDWAAACLLVVAQAAQATPAGDALAALAAAYTRAVQPGPAADSYRAAFSAVFDRVERSHVSEVDLAAVASVAAQAIRSLPPGEGHPVDVFKKAIDAGLRSVDPHARFIQPAAPTVSEPTGSAGRREEDEIVRWRVDRGVLVLEIDSFSGPVAAMVEDAVNRASAQAPLQAVVLDLRGNPGGLLRQAILTADLFLSEGQIASMRGRNAASQRTWQADPKQLLGGLPMVVLVNRGSASAAELVADALQGNGRATVMGRRSLGKGTVQTTYSISEGRGSVKLTTAHYYGPAGRTVDGSGVTPDVVLARGAPTGRDAALDPALCPALTGGSDAAIACATAYLLAGGGDALAAAVAGIAP